MSSNYVGNDIQSAYITSAKEASMSSNYVGNDIQSAYITSAKDASVSSNYVGNDIQSLHNQCQGSQYEQQLRRQ